MQFLKNTTIALLLALGITFGSVTTSNAQALGPFELEEAAWQEVLVLLNEQGAADGVPPGSPEFFMLFKTYWYLAIDDAARARQTLHNKHNSLKAQLAAQQADLDNVQAQIDALEPDPGPVPPRR